MIRRVICTTNAIESINARYRRAVRARGHFPNKQATLKCLYLVTRSLDPTGGGRARWMKKRNARAERVYDHLPRTVRDNHPLMKTTGPHTPFNGQTRPTLLASLTSHVRTRPTWWS